MNPIVRALLAAVAAFAICAGIGYVRSVVVGAGAFEPNWPEYAFLTIVAGMLTYFGPRRGAAQAQLTGPEGHNYQEAPSIWAAMHDPQERNGRGGDPMDFDDLTDEQKAKAKGCKTPEELVALAQEEGVELSDADLEAVAGGSWKPGRCTGVTTR